MTDQQALEASVQAMALVGTSYRYGGNTPKSGFDCSGLIGYVYQRAASITPPQVRAVDQRMGPSGAGQLCTLRRSGDLRKPGERLARRHLHRPVALCPCAQHRRQGSAELDSRGLLGGAVDDVPPAGRAWSVIASAHRPAWADEADSSAHPVLSGLLGGSLGVGLGALDVGLGLVWAALASFSQAFCSSPFMGLHVSLAAL